MRPNPGAMHGASGLFQWPTTLMSAIVKALSPDILAKSMLADNFTFSSQFPGMGTMEHGLMILSAKANELDFPMAPEITSACDGDCVCQDVLAAMAPCVYKDVLNFTNVNKARFALLTNYKAKLLMMRNSKLKKKAHCVVHGKELLSCLLSLVPLFVCGWVGLGLGWVDSLMAGWFGWAGWLVCELVVTPLAFGCLVGRQTEGVPGRHRRRPRGRQPLRGPQQDGETRRCGWQLSTFLGMGTEGKMCTGGNPRERGHFPRRGH